MTKGDANRTAHPWTLEPARVIGGVVAAPRMLGYWLQYLKDPAGLASLFMLIVCFSLVYSVTVEMAERRQGAQALATKSLQRAPALAARFGQQRVSARDPTAAASDGVAHQASAASAGFGGREASSGATCARRRPALAIRRSRRRVAAVGVGAPRFPGISVAVAQVVDQDRLAAVWKPVANATPVVFTCWRCGAVFPDVGEPKTHVARHRVARHEERWRATSAKRSSEERFIPIGTPRTAVAQRNFG